MKTSSFEEFSFAAIVVVLFLSSVSLLGYGLYQRNWLVGLGIVLTMTSLIGFLPFRDIAARARSRAKADGPAIQKGETQKWEKRLMHG